MSNEPKTAVLHVACHPVTGPWSVMRDLARAQAESGRYSSVGIGVIVDPSWPADYRDEIRKTGMPFYESSCPALFGTAAFLYQRLRPPPWKAWLSHFAEQAGTARVVVHLHNAWLSGVFLPLPSIEGIRVGVVATFHGVNEHFKGKPVRKAIHRWMAGRLLKYGAKLTSVDGANTALAERILGIPRSAFAVVPNGVHPVSIVKSERPRCPLVIGHVGSMIPQKGWQLVAQAAELLNRDAIHVRVVLAGRGSDDAEAGNWAAAHSGWAEYLGFMEKPRERVMPQLDVLCLMSQWEGFPMAIVEAMSVGLPTIATDVGGVSEAVRDGETGLLIPRTAEALAEAVSALIHDRVRLTQMGERALARFGEKFTMNRIVERYAKVYDGAVS
ncbi:MAG: glycosyltransferase family 4 protein [Kiritimatiellae bacterium]|nr:glycosyltransferase family 4 protein [Kiritimatiellia bacterium]